MSKFQSVNLMVTNQCNRHCSYCIAKEIIGKASSRVFVSKSHLEKLLSYIGKNMKVQLLGGEPGLHPNLESIISRIHDNGNAITLLTNGTFDFSHLKKYSPSVLLNLDENFSNYSKIQMDNIKSNLKNFGKNLSLSLNISNPFFSWENHKEIILRFNSSSYLRVGITQPILSRNNKYLLEIDMRNTAQNIIKMAYDLARQDIVILFDCGFTPCMFSESELSQLIKLGAILENWTCSPFLDIGPELEIWRCFPFSSSESIRLEDYANLDEIHTYFDILDQKLRKKVLPKNCKKCDYYNCHFCFGGCLARLLINFRGHMDLDTEE